MLKIKSVMILTILLFFGIFLFVIQKVQAEESSSLGVSPAYIRNDILLKGSYYEEELVISRANPDTEAKAILELDIKDVQNWISFKPGFEVPLPKGEQRVTVNAIIDVPDDALLGIYKGYIRVKLEEPNEEGGVTLVPSVRLDVDLTVIDENKSAFEVRLVDIEDFPRNYPLVLKMKIKNAGNVEVKPSKVMLNIKDLSQNFIKDLESNEISEIAPFVLGEVEVTFEDHNLHTGDYFGEITVYDGEKVSFDDRVVFTVLEEVEIPDTLVDINETVVGDKPKQWVVFLVLFIVMGTTLAIIVQRRRTKKLK